jgi:hypothetical protein
MAAFCLICTGVAYHSIISIVAGAAIASYAALVPLRVPHRIASLPWWRLALQAAVRTIPILAATYSASLAVNSGLPVIGAAGNLLFIGLLVLSAVLAFRLGQQGALKSFRLIAANSTSALALASAQIDLILHAFPLRRSS